MKKKKTEKKVIKKSKLTQESQKIDNLIEEIFTFIQNNPQYLILEEWHPHFLVLAKLVTLNINYTANSDGFQPVEKVESCKRWVIFLVNVASVGSWVAPKDVIKKLYDSKCQIVSIRDKDDIEKKFNEI